MIVVDTFVAVALNKILKFQRNVDLLMPKLSFQRVVREITRDITQEDFRFQASALYALQEAAEAHLVRMFEGKFYLNSYAKISAY